MVFSSAIVTTKHLGPGNVQRIDGTWVAGAVTKGTIDLTTYLSDIYAAGMCLHTGTGLVAWGYNRTDGSVTVVAAGKMAVHVCTANDAGQFWAIGPIK